MTDAQKDFAFLQQRFNRDAGLFDAIYDDESNGLQQWFNKNYRKPIYERFEIAVRTMQDLSSKSVLDVGCGSGAYLTKIAQQGANKVVGIDISESMLKFAAERIQAEGRENQCKLLQCNFLEFNFPEKYDYAIAMGVFDYLADPVTFLAKLKAVTTDKVIASFPVFSLIRGTLRKLRYILTGRGTVYYYTREKIESIARKAGFHAFELVPMKTGKGFVLVADSSK